ncbi:MAG: biotin--[acetyl-CoA-carboxylase] ligase [Chloroflexota bacterium]
MTPLSIETIHHNLSTQIFGQRVHYFPQLDSTNTHLKQLADIGEAEGTLCITDDQVAGRGRFDRRWHVPAQSSLTMSLLFQPTFLEPPYLQQLTMICALAASDAVYQQTGFQLDLKWPNDLVYAHKKVAGVLTEASFAGSTLGWAIVGVGLNVNIDRDFFTQHHTPEGQPLAETATSLQIIAGDLVDRIALLQAYLAFVEQRYMALQQGDSPYQTWLDRLIQIGKTVTVIEGNTSYTGFVKTAHPTGMLEIQRPNGSTKQVSAGEVSLRA